jgi:hypothetical protein
VLGVVFFTGAGEYDPFLIIANTLKNLAHFREWLNAREIFFFKKLGAILVELFPEALDFLSAEEFRQILIGTFAYLGAQFFARKSFFEMSKGTVPGFDMQLIGINERAVQVKNEDAQGWAV